MRFMPLTRVAVYAIFIIIVSSNVTTAMIVGGGASPGFHTRAIGSIRTHYGVDEDVRFVAAPDEQVICSLKQNCSDLSNLPIGFGIANADLEMRRTNNETLTFIPIAGTGIALVHNIRNLTAPLVLSRSLLGRIFRQCEDPTNTTLFCAANDYVDMWNHSDIVQLNPGQEVSLTRAGQIKLILGPKGSMSLNPIEDPWKNVHAQRRSQTTFQTILTSAQSEDGLLGYLPLDLAMSANDVANFVGITAGNREAAIFPSLSTIQHTMEQTLQAHPDILPASVDDCYPLAFLQFIVFATDTVATNGTGARSCDVSEYLLHSFLEYELLDGETAFTMSRHYLVSLTSEYANVQYDYAKTMLSAGCANLQFVDRHYPKFRVYVQAGDQTDALYEMMAQLITTYSQEVRDKIPDTTGIPLDVQLDYFSDATRAFDIASSPTDFGVLLQPFASMSTTKNEDVESPALVVVVSGAHDLEPPGNDHFRVTLASVPLLVLYNLCGDSFSCEQQRQSPLDMTVDVVIGILLGEITMWNDSRINAEGRSLPSEPIRVMNPPLSDGLRFGMEAILTAANGNRSFAFNPAFDAPSNINRQDILQTYVDQTQFAFTVTIPSLHATPSAAESATVFGVAPSVEALYRCASDTYLPGEGEFHAWWSRDPGCYRLGMQVELIVKKEFKGNSCADADVPSDFPLNASMNTAFVQPPPRRPSSSVFELQKFIEWLFGEKRNLPADKQQLISGVRTGVYPYELRQIQKSTGNISVLAGGLDPTPLFQAWSFAPMFDLAVVVEKIASSSNADQVPKVIVGSEYRDVISSRDRLLNEIKCIDTSLKSSSASVMESTEVLNHIPEGVIVFGYVLNSLSITSMCLMALWIYFHRDYRIVHFSSPTFLYLIVLGGIISQLTIVPLSMQDTSFYRSYGIDANELAMLDAACQSMPFLVTSGFAIAFGSLFAKTWRMARIFNPKLRRVRLTNARIAAIPMLLCLTFFILNLVWLLGPQRLRWDRYPLVVQYQDLTVLSSVGFCTVSSGDPWIAMAPQLFLVGLCLVTAMILAFRVRNLATEFQESSYIFIALGFLLQNFIIAVPVLALASSSSITSYLLKLLLIFVNSFVVVGLLMVPKMYIVHVLKDSKAGQKTNSDQAQRSHTNSKNDHEITTSKHSRDVIAPTAVVTLTNPMFAGS